MTIGQDISEFQGDINWDLYKNNTNFVMIRSSYGTSYTDKKFTRNNSEVLRVGLPHGFYHYCYPQSNTPEAEAQWFINCVWPLDEGEVMALDFEESYTGDAVTWCLTFLNYIKSHCDGLKPLIYLNQALIKKYNWQPVVDAGYGLWIAAYTYDPNNNNFDNGAWKVVAMQQWTDKQQVPGISGNVDGDVFFGTVAAFKAYGYKKPVVTPPAEEMFLGKPKSYWLQTENDKATLQRDIATLQTKEQNYLQTIQQFTLSNAQKDSQLSAYADKINAIKKLLA